jgi:hypothetical protein
MSQQFNPKASIEERLTALEYKLEILIEATLGTAEELRLEFELEEEEEEH